MLFIFLKYINPIDYFNLVRNDGNTIFPKWECLPAYIQDQIKLDSGYSSIEISHIDASWQAVQKGYIGAAETLAFDIPIPLEDEYRFARRYFNRLWVYYTLCIRLLGLNNPFKELSAFFKTRKVKRTNVYQNPIINTSWDKFQSKLLEEQPKVNVVIPTLNRYAYLKDVLKDLEAQDYANFEVIIVDQSEPFQEAFYKDFNLKLILIRQEEKALWFARNRAIKRSDAAFILLFDDDSRVEKNWIRNHLKCMDFFNAPISSGTSISVIGAKVPESYNYFKVSNQIDTGNVLIKKEVFYKIGLFDKQFEKQRMGDGEFGIRAYLAGYLNISNPFAQRLHLKVGTGGLRQLGSWDAMRPVNWFAPRPIPSVLYLYRNYFGNTIARYALLRSVPPSLVSYKYKGNNKMLVVGFLLSILLAPLVWFQVKKSWNLATEKLNEGSLIDEL